MSNSPQGIGVEISEMSVVGALLLAIVPAYAWVSKAPNQTGMIQRSAIAGTVLLAGALTYGFSKR